MGVKFTNNAIGYLAAPITDTATSLTLGAGEGNLFPQVNTGATDYFYVTITDVSGNREIVKVQLRSAGSNVLAELVRAQDGTAARAFDTGDIVDLRIPAVVLTEWETEIETNASDIATNAADIATNAAAIANITSGVEETGNKMYFYQAAAPTVGWVIDATIEDVLLAVVDQSSGGLGYDITAGNPGGSWTPTLHTHTGPSHTHTGPSHTHTGPSHSHTGGSHALTIAEMPVHSHGPGAGASFMVVGGPTTHGDPGNNYGTASATATAGSGNAHSHGATSASGTGATSAAGTGATGASGTGATGTGSAPSTDRPRAAVGIICTKS